MTVRLRFWHYVVGVLFYGFLIGLVFRRSIGTIQGGCGWLSPIVFAFYVYVRRDQYKEILKSIEDSFVWGIAFLSLYGLYQFFFLPPWDAFWMENSNLTSIGYPEPMQVRIFSTMNTPQPLANFLTAGILFGLSSKLRIRFVTMSFGVVALGLTMSRSGWMGAVIGISYMLFSFEPRRRLQAITGLCVCMLLLGAMTRIPEFNATVSQRLQSLSDLKGDGSAKDRLLSQTEATELFKSSPFGIGLGADALDGKGPSYGVARPTGIAIGDNGIEQITLPFGWAGSLIYIVGFLGAVLFCFRGSSERELVVPRAMMLTTVSQVALMGIFAGADGFLMWACIATCTAYRWTNTSAGEAVPMSQYAFASGAHGSIAGLGVDQ